MKKIYTLFLALIFIGSLIAQTPQRFKYQAVARDANGDVVADQAVGMQISILQGSTSGTAVYTETHVDTTNTFGLINIEIGNGTTSNVFSSINWSADIYFVKVEMDITGGTTYEECGTSQLLSVPYALHARTVENVDDADADSTNELQALNISNDTIFLNNGGYVKLPADRIIDADADTTNEIQNLTDVLLQGNDANNSNIINLAEPITDQDAATKAYVDALIQRIEAIEKILFKPGGLYYETLSDSFIDLAGSAFRVLHNAMQELDGPGLAMITMADQGTCSHGNAGMLALSSEPREGFTNDTTFPYIEITRSFWSDAYASINATNKILNVMEDWGFIIENEENTTKIKAWLYFISGVAHGYVGLVFDQGNVIKWDTNPDSISLSPWQDMITASIELLDHAISICDTSSFTIAANWMGGEEYTGDELSALANSYAARILAYSPRNKTNNEALDWNKILSYAQKGIQKPLNPLLGSNYDWYDNYMVYQIYPGWGRVDHRIINIMDHDYPSRWPNDNVWPDGDPGEATSNDARLASDFEYMTDQVFRPERGYYHFSHYRFSRYDDVIAEVWYGNKNKPSFLVWENEMLEAEALVRTGNVAGAVATLNDANGARKVRGQLPDVTSTDAAEVLRIIFDEKDIELFNSGMGIGYFDMRRRDQLQSGTILHFPIPFTTLEILQEPIYTIGGTPDGENVSMGSWTGYDGLTSPPVK